MAADADKFVVASFALWAGDVDRMRSLLGEVPPDRSMSLADVEAIESPEDLINFAAALRLRQLAQKVGEFRKAAAALRRDDVTVVEQPRVLTTPHLRGAIWRTGPREFLLKGYIAELEWEEQFFSWVRELDQSDAEQQSPPQVESSTLKRAERRVGGAWVLTGNPFVQVEVSDMGLIEATAIWTGEELPANVAPIESAFEKLLFSLDPRASNLDHEAGTT